MDTAKLFLNGRSQAVRLPREYAFAGDSVHIKKIDDIVLLIPKGAEWDLFERSLEKFSEDYLATGRSQGTAEQRECVD
jgi:antitoxin VapB